MKGSPIMLVISSPSGAGKTTICKKLLEMENKAKETLYLSISMTTREKRKNEIDGSDYHFISVDQFELLNKKQEFLESAKVFDNYYGTPKESVLEKLTNDTNVLFDIDWQGAATIKRKHPQQCVSIFLLPPSMQDLKTRLEYRAMDSSESIQKRISESYNEIKHFKEYDYVLVNDDLEKTLYNVRSILHAEQLKRVRSLYLTDFIDALLDSQS